MATTVADLGRNLETAGKLFRLLSDGGLHYEAIHVLLNDKETRALAVDRLNELAVTSDKAPGFQQAREILWDDFITPETVSATLDVSYSPMQLLDFRRNFPSKEMLYWARNNNFAIIPGPPREMNLLDIHELNTDLFYLKNDPWFADKRQKFARKDTVGTTWLIVRKDPVASSTRKTWLEQQALLSDLERVPNVAEAVWFFTTYAAVRGIRLVPSVYVRTSSVGSDGFRIGVGDFIEQGLRVNYYGGDRRHDFIGLASARK